MKIEVLAKATEKAIRDLEMRIISLEKLHPEFPNTDEEEFDTYWFTKGSPSGDRLFAKKIWLASRGK